MKTTVGKQPRLRPRPERRVTRKVLSFDLKTEGEALQFEPPWKTHGHNAKTLVRRDDVRIVLSALKAGIRIHAHEYAASTMIQVLHGRIRVHLPDETVELSTGMMLSVAEGLRHDIEARAESLLLLSFAGATILV